MRVNKISKEEAVELFDSKFWNKMSLEERAKFQLFTNRLCMPFDIFQEAMESTLKCPIFTHEFAHADNLRKRFLGKMPNPTLQEIINLIPEGKRILVMEE
jgi:hypothetical protein